MITTLDAVTLKKLQAYLYLTKESFLAEKTGGWEWDLKSNKIFVSPSLSQILGFERQQRSFGCEEWIFKIHPDQKDSFEKSLNEYLCGKTLSYETFYQLLYKDGTWRWFHDKGKIVSYDAHGQPSRMLGYRTDITDLLPIFQHLHDSESTPGNTLSRLLLMLLSLTTSKYGFIGKITDDSKLRKFSQVKYFCLDDNLRIEKEGEELYVLDENLVSVFESSKILICNFITHAHPFFPGFKSEIKLENYMIAPIYDDSKLTGIVGIANRMGGYDENTEIAILRPILEAIGSAIKTQEATLFSENRDMLELFIKHTPVEIAMFDKQLRYITASDAWLRRNNLVDKSIFGTTVGVLSGNLFPAYLYDAAIQCLEQGAVKTFEAEKIIKPDESIVWLYLKFQPWYTANNEVGGLVIFTKDVSASKQEGLRLQEMIKKLEYSNQKLERFAYVCSHDIKGPLRSIASLVQLVIKDNIEKMDDQTQRYMQVIRKSIENLDDLLNDILNYSKIDFEETDLKTIDTKTVVEEVKSALNLLIEDNQAIVTSGCLPYVHGDKTQIMQVFKNLIENAIKYRSEPNPIIDIQAFCRDQCYEFVVKDNGIGIKEQYHTEVFGMFKRLHTKHQSRGSGIGLAICKKIIEHYKGEIWITSNPEGGSIFHFTLPLPN